MLTLGYILKTETQAEDRGYEFAFIFYFPTHGTEPQAPPRDSPEAVC